jgi:hypothetical protein
MLLRALLIWFAILLLASANGAVRDLALAPRLGDPVARAFSTIVLCALILLVTWLSIRWIGPRSRRDALMIGALWVSLTLAFEFLAGHYLFGKPWTALLEDYDLARGRVWVLALVTTFTAPLLMAAPGPRRPRGR